ncbi:MAG TPA: 2OG-Fe(II) oxygenase [Steroidobacteraceae bacterium]|nr:2OG-Fe(II) oxygenase [Steroidobacteraceae bacterium]
MSSDSIDQLRARARSGDLSALTTLGKCTLVGEGIRQSPQEGIALIRDAAARGNADANALLAVFAAWAVLQPRNIEAALDHLARAAQLGGELAQRELRLLARAGGDDWAALRRKVDVTALTTPPAMRVAVERPRIVVIDHFASTEECDWLIERGRPELRRARVYHGSEQLETADERTNSEADFTVFRADITLSLIRERMAVATRAPTSHFEITKLLHYRGDEHFGLHADFLELNTPELVREVEARGQRAMTLLVYLNEGYEGGETEFPKVGFRYKGARGGAMFFTNIDGAGAPDYSTVHAGLPPSSGEKWLLSQWIRTRPVTG